MSWVFLTVPSVLWTPGVRGLPPVRPTLSGPTEHRDAGRFRVWFTREGVDAPDPTDADRDGDPDLVDVVVDELVSAEAAYLAEGWRPLVGDAGVGGSDALDVYLEAIDAFGYTYAVPASDGSSACFIALDPALTLPGEVARSVVAHELHHCVEFRYTSALTLSSVGPTPATWIYESAATYEQYSHVRDPLLDVAVGVLYGERLGAPDRKLAAADGRFEYAGFLWTKYWSEAHDAAGQRPVAPAGERLLDLWTALGEADGWVDGMDAASEATFGRDLGSTFLDHAVWNAFACKNDDGGHYLADPLPCVASVGVPVVDWDGAPIDVVHEESPYTAAYLRLPTTGPRAAIRCDGGDDLLVAAVSTDSDGAQGAARVGRAGDEVSVPTAPAGTLTVVLAGTDTALDARCEQVDAPAPGLRGCTTAGGSAGALAAGIAGLAAGVGRRRGRPVAAGGSSGRSARTR